MHIHIYTHNVPTSVHISVSLLSFSTSFYPPARISQNHKCYRKPAWRLVSTRWGDSEEVCGLVSRTSGFSLWLSYTQIWLLVLGSHTLFVRWRCDEARPPTGVVIDGLLLGPERRAAKTSTTHRGAGFNTQRARKVGEHPAHGVGFGFIITIHRERTSTFVTIASKLVSLTVSSSGKNCSISRFPVILATKTWMINLDPKPKPLKNPNPKPLARTSTLSCTTHRTWTRSYAWHDSSCTYCPFAQLTLAWRLVDSEKINVWHDSLIAWHDSSNAFVPFVHYMLLCNFLSCTIITRNFGTRRSLFIQLETNGKVLS